MVVWMNTRSDNVKPAGDASRGVSVMTYLDSTLIRYDQGGEVDGVHVVVLWLKGKGGG